MTDATLRLETIHDGSHPNMAIVDVLAADGEIVQFEVERPAIVDGRYPVGFPVARREDGALLVELSTQYGCLTGGRDFGAHRVWVPAASLSWLAASEVPT